jgi:hypothetical protein
MRNHNDPGIIDGEFIRNGKAAVRRDFVREKIPSHLILLS